MAIMAMRVVTDVGTQYVLALNRTDWYVSRGGAYTTIDHS